MSEPDDYVHVQRLNKIKKKIKTNCTSLITQGPKINDLLLTAIEECFSASEKNVEVEFCSSASEKNAKVEFCCWEFLFLYCSSFGKLVSLSAGDLKVLIKHLTGYIEVKDATVQLRDKIVVPKKRRKQTGIVEETGTREPETEAWNLHHVALKALNALLIASSDDIEESDYKELSQVIVRQLLDIYCKQDYLTGVYTILELREDLLKLLRTLILVPNFVRLRPIQPAEAIFTKALNWEQDSDLKMFCRESLFVLKLIARPTLPVEIAFHSKTVPSEILCETVPSEILYGTVPSETLCETELNHFEEGGTVDNGEMEEQSVNGLGTATADDSVDMTTVTERQTQSETCSGCPIVTIDLEEPTMKSPSPRKVEDQNQSIVSISGSSNYVTANDSTLTGIQILSPESDYMEILDELS